MAIQIPNPGTGNGATGDNEFVLWTKVKDNFSNTTHAASKLVGTASGQIPLVQDVFKATFSTAADISFYAAGGVGKSCNDLLVGSFVAISDTMSNSPPAISGGAFGSTWVVETRAGFTPTTHKIQTAYSYASTTYKVYSRRFYNNAWSAWVQMTESADTYQTTTASGANVVVDTTGKLMRSTSISYTNTNTTKDSNGFIKAASPIVKVFADKVELNGEAVDQDVTYKKNGVGDYTITTVSGLSTDGWYIELPKDMNGNPKVAVTLSEVDGVISLKTYKRIFSMETFTFEPDLDNPLDIPDTRWIDLRLNEIPVEAQEELPTDGG